MTFKLQLKIVFFILILNYYASLLIPKRLKQRYTWKKSSGSGRSKILLNVASYKKKFGGEVLFELISMQEPLDN
jgi:hypothetical protein